MALRLTVPMRLRFQWSKLRSARFVHIEWEWEWELEKRDVKQRGVKWKIRCAFSRVSFTLNGILVSVQSTDTETDTEKADRQDNTHSSVTRPKQLLPQIGLAPAVNVSHAALRVIALLSPFNQLNFVQILRYFTSFFSFFFSACLSFFSGWRKPRGLTTHLIKYFQNYGGSSSRSRLSRLSLRHR